MKKQNILDKAVVLTIVAVFIGSAFVPAVGSQVEDGIVDIQGFSDDDRSVVSDDSLLDRVTIGIHRLIDILGDNPIVYRLRELFNGKDVDSNTNLMDKDQLTSESQIDMLNEYQDQLRVNPDPLPLGAGGPWWNSNWGYRKPINISHEKVDDDLTNFPVLISFTSDTELADDARCQNSGDDIVFTDSSGNKLNHEIEFFDGSTGELVAWVNVTYLSGSEDTILYMYYGNATCGSQENVECVRIILIIIFSANPSSRPSNI